MAKEATSPTLRFGLSEDTLDRIKGAGEAGRPKEGDKTIFDTAIEGLDTIKTGIEASELAKELALTELDEVLAANIDGRKDWTTRTTLDAVIALQETNKEAYIKAIDEGDTQEQARLLDLNKAQSASLVDWKESFDLLSQMYSEELFSKGYLKNHPEAADLIKQMASQKDAEGNDLVPQFDDEGEMYFTMTVNGVEKNVYTRDIDKIIAEAGATTSVEAVGGPFPEDWNYQVSLANNINAYKKGDILLQTFEDEGQFGGTTTLKNDLIDAFEGATVDGDGNLTFPESTDPNAISAGNVAGDLKIPATGGLADGSTINVDGTDTVIDLDKNDDGTIDAKELQVLDRETLTAVFDVMLSERDKVSNKLVHKETLAALAGTYLTDLQVQNGAGKPKKPTVIYETETEKQQRNRNQQNQVKAYTAAEYLGEESTGDPAQDMALLRQKYGDTVVDQMIAAGELKES